MSNCEGIAIGDRPGVLTTSRAHTSESRLLVLGGGRHQLLLIERAEARGIRVVLSDNLPDSLGRKVATYPTSTDCLDVEANIRLAVNYRVNGVTTSGTDQAVVTMAEVASALGLPCYLSRAAARAATNKLEMKELFARHQIPVAPFVAISGEGTPSFERLDHLGFPLVVKPADSQGGRGIRLVTRTADLAPAIEQARQFSRARTVLVEQFIDGAEITVNGWVQDGKAHILVVTDRVTFNRGPILGICFQHIYPSERAQPVRDSLPTIVQKIAQAHRMQVGPLYIQMLVRGADLFVVEAACRVGGGHENLLIPLVTGVEVTDRLIDLALFERCQPVDRDDDDAARRTMRPSHALVNFLFAHPGKVGGAEELERERTKFQAGGYYVGPGHVCRATIDAQDRVGFFLAEGDSRAQLLNEARAIYSRLRLPDQDGRDLLFWPADEG